MVNDQNAQQWIEILNIALVKATPICVMFPQFIISFYVYFTTNLGNDAFEMPFPVWYEWNIKFSVNFSRRFLLLFKKFLIFAWIVRFPFNWKHPFGYVIAVILQFIVTFAVLIANFCFGIFGIGSFYMLNSLAEYIKCDLDSLNRSVRDKADRFELLTKIQCSIQSHSDAIQLSKKWKSPKRENWSHMHFPSL